MEVNYAEKFIIQVNKILVQTEDDEYSSKDIMKQKKIEELEIYQNRTRAEIDRQYVRLFKSIIKSRFCSIRN